MADAELDKFSIRVPKVGETRRVSRIFRKGTVLVFDNDPDSYQLTYDIKMDVMEEYKYMSHLYENRWVLKSYFTETTSPVPTRWQRFKRWLHVPVPTLPTAKVVSE